MSPAPNHLPSGNNQNQLLLIKYFRSGWVFFIPYLAAYLFYAWLKWPVNPDGSYASAIISSLSPSVTYAPSLLSVYRFLHLTHLITGIAALIYWSKYQITHTCLPKTIYSLLPWLCLALLFWIPGIYLEWPSDPWEHLRRINEWHVHGIVTEHSAWKKSSYFLPYSLSGHLTGLSQLNLLNFYYTAVCMLLSWQYYRLARAVSIGKRASFIFVLLNAFTFGNNIFSFYRYYGLSSSIVAQLGAVALIRMALELASHPIIEASLSSITQKTESRSFIRYHLPLIISAVAILLLIALNHIQGIGIAGLGVLAVVVWRLIEWKRLMIGWLLTTGILASIAIVQWFPRHPALDQIYRPQGWLNILYGFNLFSLGSPSFERSLQILGAFGVLNLIVGLYLVLHKNHVAGWLVLMPLFALAMPCFALPVAHVLASHSSPNDAIVTFHRLIFAAPLGLALVAAFSRSTFASQTHGKSHDWYHSTSGRTSSIIYYIIPSTVLVAVSLAPDGITYNRLWHSLEIPPADLQLHDLISESLPLVTNLTTKEQTLVIAGPQSAQALEALYSNQVKSAFRSDNRFSLLLPQDMTGWLNSVLREISTHTFSYQCEISSAHTSCWFVIPFDHRSETSTLQRMDLTALSTLWLYLDDPNKVFTPSTSLTVGNYPGQPAHLFTSELIKIHPRKHYRVFSTVRQSAGTSSLNFLAIAWYDHDGRVLYSNLSSPKGAGYPIGWANGSYSYYGLFGQTAPVNWRRYSISFGYGESSAIPSNASYLRIGALLNFSATSCASLLLKDVSLEELPAYTKALFFLPLHSHLFTVGSLAGHLSRHWDAQLVHYERIGTSDIRTMLNNDRTP